MEGIILTPLKKIQHPKGDIFHALKSSEADFVQFGEAYFTSIKHKEIKGWKKHTKMTMNLIVPVGNVRFLFHDEKNGMTEAVILGESNYQRLNVSPGVWMAFEGVGEGLNLVLNIASIQHDLNEAQTAVLEEFPV